MSLLNRSLRRLAVLASLFIVSLASTLPALAQRPQSRIQANLSNASRMVLPGSRSPLARSENDLGRTEQAQRLAGMTLVFAPSPAQQADLQQLIAAQQNPASPQYHAWLTPEQFAARFGMSDEDLATTGAWLQQQGFSVDSVSRSRTRIQFSGTVAQAEAAFGTEIHNFNVRGETRFAPATEISLPAALANVTLTVRNLSSIRPRSHVRVQQNVIAPKANFTSSQSNNTHFLTPGDIRTIYDINPAYNAGYTGAGQTIAVVGQSAVVASDIEAFQTAAGLTVKDPTMILVPNSGMSTVYANDESESDLDLEYSGAIAPGATIKFIYAGSNQNASVQDAEAYAVDNDVAPIISVSYGQCEGGLAPTDYTSQEAIYAQAAAQGQTVVAASGDDGSSDCASNKMSGLYADYPASSQYVTGLGGTEFTSAAVAQTNTTYWTAANGSDVISSAKSYMPEQVWNDSTTSGLSSGGGGPSMLSARPSWQTGVTGIPSGSFRLTPDISLTSSPSNAGYLYCSSDVQGTGVTGSCANGFRDSTDTYLTVAGGTSFAAPIFSGMVALVNQASGVTGQGLINPKLYSLAANSTTYATAFHDITTGTNACTVGYIYCSTAASGSFSATAGYDQATGLGSVDFYNLLTAWVASGSSTTTLLASSTTLSAATLTPASGATDAIAITVASNSTSSTAVPTGTVAVTVDGGDSTTVNLNNGTAAYTFSSTIAGTHSVTVVYSGDSTFGTSAASLTLTVPSTATVTASFAVAATNLIVADGNSGASTVTLTPAGGYTGTVDWTVAVSPSLTNSCYSIANTKVSGTAAVTTALTVYTSASACTSLTPLTVRGGRHAFVSTGAHASAQTELPGRPETAGQRGATLACAAFGLLGLASFRRRRLRALAAVVVMTAAGFALTGCGNSTTSSGGTTTVAPTGNYTITLTGADSASATLTSSTKLTLTVD